MKGDNSPPAEQAALAVLETLAHAGKHADSVYEAVQVGYLTIYDWCDVLNEYRERYRVGQKPRD